MAGAFDQTPIDDYRDPRLPSARDDIMPLAEAQTQQSLANGGAFGSSGGFLSDLGEGARNWWNEIKQFPSSVASLAQAAYSNPGEFSPISWHPNAAFQLGREITTAPFSAAKNILDTQAYEREKGLPIIPQTGDLLNVGMGAGALSIPLTAALPEQVGALSRSVPKVNTAALRAKLTDTPTPAPYTPEQAWQVVKDFAAASPEANKVYQDYLRKQEITRPDANFAPSASTDFDPKLPKPNVDYNSTILHANEPKTAAAMGALTGQREVSDLGFYSPLLEAAAKNLKQGKGQPDQMVKALANAPGVSPREIEATAPPTNRISTRLPGGVRATEDPNGPVPLTIGMPAYLKSVSENNSPLLADYAGMKDLQGLPHDQIAQGYVRKAADNLLFLHDAIPAGIRKRSSQWYDGANKIVNAVAEKYGLPPQSVAGAYASLSPQLDWFQNASLGERVTDILMNENNPMTPQMRNFATNTPSLQTPTNVDLFRSIEGSRLQDLKDPDQKALWIRLFDEAHNPRGYRVITPEGRYGDFMTTNSGAKRNVGWKSVGEIAKAVGSLESGGDISKISDLMGGRHKVRSFYNNIIDPNSPAGDVTADTHQVAANLMTPLSGGSTEVSHSLGTNVPPGQQGASSSKNAGVVGTYAPNAEAVRLAAIDRGILPRQMQSITWEAIRSLFSPTFKAQAKNVDAIKSIWKSYDDGKISANDARKAIVKYAGGFKKPDWVGSNSSGYDPRRYSTYKR